MTTHPAPDPFAFDPARVERRTVVSSGVAFLSYTMPDGRVLEHEEIEDLRETLCGSGGRNIRVPNDALVIWLRFENAVRELSAHQKMAWMAAAQAEGAAP